MLSLQERIELLEADLTAIPMRISAYRDLPFAILRYEPDAEWELRRQIRLLATRLGAHSKQAHIISLAEILWQVIDQAEGLDAVIEMEKEWGFRSAQEQVGTYLSDRDWQPLPSVLAEKLASLNPRQDVVFLTRAAAMAPSIYQMSKLLDEMHGRTMVPIILCYPGGIEGQTGLRFMNLKGREALGNYRVKIYGAN